MTDQSTIKDLIITARDGNKLAEEELFSKLSVRFSTFITQELRKYPILTNRINLDEASREICEGAMNEVKRLCSLKSPASSILQMVSVLHNVLDNFITNSLVQFAKQGCSEAENLLFAILRKKLMERITKRRWRESQYEYEDK